MGQAKADLQTVSEIIDRLGGDQSVAKWLRVPRDDVRRWIALGEIGRGYALHVYVSLQAAGYAANPMCFGVAEWSDLMHPGIVPYARRRRRRREWHKSRVPARA